MEGEDKNNDLLKSASRLIVPEIRSKEEAWNLLEKKIQEQKPGKKTIRLTRYISLSMAASIIFFLVAYIFLFPKTVTSGRAQHLSFTLPDLSTVILNAESEMEYRPWNWRSIELKGEAFFDVQPGRKFTVETQSGTVEVTGTSFNVCQRDDAFSVSCFSGSVHVRSGNSSVNLVTGETTQLNENVLTKPSRVDEKTASWRKGEFYFENIPLELVKEELERQFDLDIEMPHAANRTYSGYFNKSDLEEALRLVFEPMNLTYKKEGKKIIVQ